jgi:hypothetical protein
MLNKIDEGYEPSKALEQFYGTGNEKVLDFLFTNLGRYLYNYERYGELGLKFEIIEKGLLIDFLAKGKNYLEQQKDVIVRELKNQNICEVVKSPEFKNTEKFVLFINGMIAQPIGVPIAISMTVAEIIVIYGVEKYCECK